ncbi:unnamed protein product, partial [Durusdinium trenchii]
MSQWKALVKVLVVSSFRQPHHTKQAVLPQGGKTLNPSGYAAHGRISRPAHGLRVEHLQQLAALGPMGSWYFCAAYTAALCFAVPATPLTLSAGYLFGFQLGFLIAILAGGVAGGLCFVLSRTLLRPSLIRLAANNKAFHQINRAVELEGFKIIFLLRLSPLIPFSILAYACGLSKVSCPAFLIANLLGFMPCTAALVYAATHARSVVESGGALPLPTYIAAALATLIIILLVSKVAKRALETARDKGPYILEEHIVSSGLEKRPHHLLFYCDFEAAIWLQCCADVSIQRRLRRGWKSHPPEDCSSFSLKMCPERPLE